MIKTPLVPLKPNHKTQCVLALILGFITLAFWTIIFPRILHHSFLKHPSLFLDNHHLFFAVPSGALSLLVIVSYVLACARDPGKLTAGPKLDFLDLLQRFVPTDLCPDCQVIRTPRSRHCAICNVCVERFDHHCPWINNCVGVSNHNPFLVFLASTFTLILFSVAVVLTSK